MDERVWRAVQVKPGCEARVMGELDAHTGQPRSGLRRLGVECYVPMEVFAARVRRKMAVRSRPLIRGYVFALISDDEFPLVREIDGAVKVVRMAGQPALVPTWVIADFREAEAAGLYDETRDRKRHPVERRRYEPGDLVKVKVGPFRGMVGRVARLNNKRRVEVLLASLEAWTRGRVDVDRADLDLVTEGLAA
jgi:transcription antitermination factor NusG